MCAVLCLAAQSRPTLCDPMNSGLPGLLSMAFSRQEDWSELPCPPPGDLPAPGTALRSPALQVDSSLSETPGKPMHVLEWVNEVAQSCLTLCDPMDCSPPGSLVRGIIQARILEWVTLPFSRESSWPRSGRSPALQADSLQSEPPGEPHWRSKKLKRVNLVNLFFLVFFIRSPQ